MKKQLTDHTFCDIRLCHASLPVPSAFNVPAKTFGHWRIFSEVYKGECVAYEYYGLHWFTCFYGDYNPINSVGFVSRANCLRALRSTFKNLHFELVEVKNAGVKTTWKR